MDPALNSDHKIESKRRALAYLRVTATLGIWITLIACAHSLAHAYEAELVHLFATPFAKLAAAALFLTALVYFICLSLPFVPRLGARAVALIFVWSALLVLGHSVSHESFHEVQASLGSMRDQVGLAGLILVAFIYAVALAMPFVPGVELGLLMIALFGTTGAVTAHLATVAGLCLAFTTGRMLPEKVARNMLTRIGIDQSGQDMNSSMRGILGESPAGFGWSRRFGRWLLRHRHASLAVCLNFPGNSVAGGGGGLALLCGVSGQFGWRGFVLTAALATSPLPLLVLFGVVDAEPLLQHHGFVHDLLERIGRLFIHP